MSSSPRSSLDPVMLDTNLLVYASVPELSKHTAAQHRLAQIQASGRAIYICPQIIREFLAVMTRQQYFKTPVAREVVLAAASAYQDYYPMVPETPGSIGRLFGLLRNSALTGRKVYDANLVATALENGVGAILTANDKDFAVFAGLIRIETL